MYDQYLHIYEKLPLGVAGLLMGLALIALHGYALLRPERTKAALAGAAENDKAGRFLLTVDFIWIFLLLLDVSWNPLRMNLFDFNSLRSLLVILCPLSGSSCTEKRRPSSSRVHWAYSCCCWPLFRSPPPS